MAAQPWEGMQGYLLGTRAGLAARNRLRLLPSETVQEAVGSLSHTLPVSPAPGAGGQEPGAGS